MRIGERLKRKRETLDGNGITLAELGRRVEKTERQVWAWESNRSLPRVDAFWKLAKELGVDPRWLAGDPVPEHTNSFVANDIGNYEAWEKWLAKNQDILSPGEVRSLSLIRFSFPGEPDGRHYDAILTILRSAPQANHHAEKNGGNGVVFKRKRP
jgi:transcriptional regulator with XRE-family HTH domain